MNKIFVFFLLSVLSIVNTLALNANDYTFKESGDEYQEAETLTYSNSSLASAVGVSIDIENSSSDTLFVKNIQSTSSNLYTLSSVLTEDDTLLIGESLSITFDVQASCNYANLLDSVIVTLGAPNDADIEAKLYLAVSTPVDYPSQASATELIELCEESSSTTLFGTAPAIGTEQWFLESGSGDIDDPNSNFSNVSGVDIGSNKFVYRIENEGCFTYDTLEVVRSLNPTSSVAGTSQGICTDSYTMAANSPAIGTGLWVRLSGSGTFSDVNDPEAELTNIGIGSNEFEWRISNGGCPTSKSSLIIERFEDVESPDAGDAQVTCSDEITLEAVEPTIGTGIWITGGDAVIEDPNSNVTNVTNLSDGTNIFLWVVTNGACDADNDVVIITRDDELSQAQAGDDQQVCNETTAYLTAEYPDKGFGDWETILGTGTVLNVSNPVTEITNLSVGENKLVWTISAGSSCEPTRDTISVWRDGIAPEITCPADVNIDNDENECFAVFTYAEPVGTDNCPDPITEMTAGLASGEEFPIGTTVITYEVTDDVGASASCSFEVTVSDTTLPEIICPSDITVDNSFGQFGANVNYSIPVGTDNCTGVTTSQVDASGLTSGSFFEVGSIELEYQTVDVSGNTASCSFTVTVEDVELPTIDCPDDIEYTIPIGGCEAVLSYDEPTYSDNGDDGDVIVTQTAGLGSGVNYSPGVTTNTFTATDLSGNVATCSFTVTVNDVEDPEIICPADVVVDNDLGICGAVVNHPNVLGTDQCNSYTISRIQGIVDGGVFPVGVTLNEYQIEDNSGNTDQCTFTVTVNDTEAPVPTCLDTIIVETDASLCSANVTYALPTATDNCSSVTAQLVDLGASVSGDDFPTGITSTEYYFEDDAGNGASCFVHVEVVDTELPEITCQSDINETVNAGECDKAIFFDASPFTDNTDNCGIASTVRSDASGLLSGDIFPIGTTTVSYLTTDINGNTNSCSFLVRVRDEVNPDIVCPPNQEIENDLDVCGGTFTLIEPTHSDLCSSTSLSQTTSFEETDFYEPGVYTVSWEAEDVSGNISSCSYDFTVVDKQVPVLVSETNVSLEAEVGFCSSGYTFSLPLASDNCDSVVVTQTLGLVSGSNFPVGVSMLGFVAVDTFGNVSDTLKYAISIIDNELPTITCPEVGDFSATNCEANVLWNLPDQSDNCSVDVFGVLNSNFDVTIAETGSGVLPVGYYEATYEVEDAQGNIAQCGISFSVIETDPPVITCPSDIDLQTSAGQPGVVIDFEDAVAVDACSSSPIVSQTSGPASNDFVAVGSYTVEYEATDSLGNSSSCSFTIDIEDNEAPAITCPGDTIVYAGASSGYVQFVFDLPEAVDNYGVFSVARTSGLSSGSDFGIGKTELHFEAEDSAGNSSTCSYEVEVQDLINPVISCPADVFVCGVQAVDYDVAIATDNASDIYGEPTVEFNFGTQSGEIFSVGNSSVSFKAIDGVGNESTCVFIVSVGDTSIKAEIVSSNDSVCDLSFDLEAVSYSNFSVKWMSETGVIDDSSAFSTTIDSLEIGENRIVLEAVNGGCPLTYDTLVVVRNEMPTPAVILYSDTTFCGGSTLLNITSNEVEIGGFTWSVSEGNATIQTPSSTGVDVTLVENDNSTISLVTKNGVCDESEATVNINYLAVPEIEMILSADTIYFEEETELTAQTIYPVIWETSNDEILGSDTFNIVSPAATTEYYVTAYNTEDCSASDSITVWVLQDIKIYTGLTPNGDGVNDNWVIRGLKKYDPENIKVEVYSSWGRKVFESTGYDVPWDGTDNGNSLSFGSYYYIVDINEDGFEPIKGVVALIK